MNNVLIDVLLSLKIEDDSLVAHLAFSNNTGKGVYLDEETICFYNDVTNRYFFITDSDGQVVRYTGMMGKREIEPEYFQLLSPGGKIETKLNLSEFYRLEKGNKYTVKYAAHNPYYMDVQKGFDMQSNKVEILFE